MPKMAKIAYFIFRPYLNAELDTFVINLGKIFDKQLFVDKIIQPGFLAGMKMTSKILIKKSVCYVGQWTTQDAIAA